MDEVRALRVFVTAAPGGDAVLPATFVIRSGPAGAETKTTFLTGAEGPP